MPTGDWRRAVRGQPRSAATADNDIKIIHLVQKTQSPTQRSTLDLLGLPFPFSQVGLLQPSEFVKAAGQRRITMWAGRALDESGLQELHRRGVLVPFFCVSIAEEPTGDAVEVSHSLTGRHVHGTIVNQLYAAAVDGRVTDPAAEPFSSWPSARVRTLWPSVERGYLYSHHQLLALHRARSIVGSLRPRTAGKRRLQWFLPEEDWPDEEAQKGLDSWRALAVTLTALDTRAWPHITNVIHHSAEVWRAATTSQDSGALAAWLGITATQLRKQSECLRANASFVDVLGDFYELVRRAKPQAWESLQGDARCALDERMAADVLDRFANELAPPVTASGLPPESLSQQRVSAHDRSLDAVLTDLHLSPHPPLVVALEGKTEMAVFPKVMAVLGVNLDPSWIKIVDFEGTKDLSLLARFAAEPLLGADHGNFVLLDRPVTRFLVLADAENKLATAALRARQRRLLLDSITRGLPRDLSRDLYSRGARIAEIVTWGQLPWEFAHFTDRQLADGLLGRADATFPAGRDTLVTRIAHERKSRKPNIENVWPASGINNLKVTLASALWPRLEQRIEIAITKGTTGPPIMKAAIRAHELAMLSYRLQMSVRRHRQN